MRPATETDMKPGETLHLRNGYTVKPVTCGIMLTFKATPPKEGARQ